MYLALEIQEEPSALAELFHSRNTIIDTVLSLNRYVIIIMSSKDLTRRSNEMIVRFQSILLPYPFFSHPLNLADAHHSVGRRPST